MNIKDEIIDKKMYKMLIIPNLKLDLEKIEGYKYISKIVNCLLADDAIYEYKCYENNNSVNEKLYKKEINVIDYYELHNYLSHHKNAYINIIKENITEATQIPFFHENITIKRNVYRLQRNSKIEFIIEFVSDKIKQYYFKLPYADEQSNLVKEEIVSFLLALN